MVAAIVLPSSLASWADVDHPQLAARIAPWNATADADAAASLGANPRSPRVRTLVRRALGRDLTQVPAIELRALDFAMSGNPAEARRLFHLSDRLSRRSLPTRLWLIQDSVDRGDVTGALHDFDIALRTSADAQPILFPVLARASGDPRVTASIARTLDRPSEWRLLFFEWALANDGDFRPIANDAARMRDRRFVVANDVAQRLIERLASAGQFGPARMLNRKFGREVSGVADPNFSNPSMRYPFGWGLVSSGGIGAERAVGNGSAVLNYRADAANSGQVAAQLLGLSAGRYALVTRTAANATGAVPYWFVTCAGDSDQLAQLDQPMSANVRAQTMFTVPSGCAAQWLTLMVRPAPDSNRQSGAIASISITRL